MPAERFERLKPALQSILYTLICSHCHKQFGVNGGTLVKEAAV